MQIYGYKKRAVSAKGLMEMKEVTFSGVSSKGLRDIAEFILKCADEKEKNPDYDHVHASAKIAKWNDKWPDIIIAK